LTAGADIDLRDLADIAGDSSVAGRAKLFAFLAALLISRWASLTSGEQDQLAELVALLWPRGDPADRQRLSADLAGKTDVPASLRHLLPAPAPESLPSQQADAAEPTQPISTAAPPPPAPPSPTPPPKPSKPTITITVSQPVFIKRQSRPLAVAVAPAKPARPETSVGASPLTTASPSAEAPRPAREAFPDMVPDETFLAADLPAVTPPRRSEAQPDAAPVSRQAAGDVAHHKDAHHGDTLNGNRTHAPAAPEIVVEAVLASQAAPALPPPPAPIVADRLAWQVTTAEDNAAPPPEPRENPHRLSPALLGDALAQGDLARFEVMLAHLSGLRAPLLRRLLRDSGGEGFAILARAADFDAASFAEQLPAWRHHQRELGRVAVPPKDPDPQRINAFFGALTDQQVDRLIQRWRSDDQRLFARIEAEPVS
jgi:hypothetical protein